MRGAGVDVRRARVGLVVGATTGGMFENERLLARLHAEPESREALAQALAHPLSATGDRLHALLGPFARVRTVSSACSTGANALVVAAGWLLAGEVDVVVAGASDGLCRLTFTGFNALAALDPETCRPFDRRRRGTSLGEGAGFLVLERAESAHARGAVPVAELAGWALGSEAHHVTHPDPEGSVVTRLVQRAVERAGRTAREIDYVNAHGTGTLHNDAMEARALRRALGAEVERIPVSSSKAQIGHTLGAAGAIEAAITALVVSRRILVPTASLDEPDAELGLVHVPHVGKPVERVRAAISNAFGFGGMDTVLVFTEPGPPSGRSGPVGRASEVVVTGASTFAPGGLLGAAACAELQDGRLAPDAPFDLDAHLDPVRSRRFDCASRLAVVAAERAMQEAAASDGDTGIVLGSAFGYVDGTAAFMHRIFVRGPRAASPAEFPGLVPSSPVGHASIYLGVHGPAFAVADLATSGEGAFAQAVQLVRAGEASRIVAGAVEPRSDIVERALAALPAAPAGPSRVDLAAALVVESGETARGRGAPVLAIVRHLVEWRDDPGEPVSLPEPRGDGSEVVLARPSARGDEILRASSWSACPRFHCASVLGESYVVGAAAIAVAASRVGRGRAREVLVLGVAPGRGYAIVLARP
jgi:3-oxoacyl-[acyl-carrier-protein] synthase II